MALIRRALWIICALLVCVASPASAIEISAVSVATTTDSTATIKWKTDIPADATINYGLDANVGVVRNPSFELKDHSLTIDNLDPLTTYFFRIISADTSGNRSTTGSLIFTTKQSLVPNNKIKKDIEKIKDPEELKKLQEQVQNQLEVVINPPSIVGPPKVFAESTTAEVTWSTDRESSSLVYFAKEGEYAAGRTNPYNQTQGDPKELTTKHKVVLRGLDPSSVYHFKVSSEDSAGLTGDSEDDTFRTKSKLPEITNARVTRVQETSAVVSWSNGGVPAKGIVEYTNTRTKVKKLAGNPTLAPQHSIILAELEFGVRYTAEIRATNEAGDEVTSKPLAFVTTRDRVPPEIAKVNNESTLFPGEEVKIQTIISWVTDEPTICQVSYAQGLAGSEGQKGDQLPEETNPVTTHTQVIVGFASATVYQFWIICKDEAGNQSRSDDFVLITPVKEKSIIDIILENFEGTFGWLKNVGN